MLVIAHSSLNDSPTASRSSVSSSTFASFAGCIRRSFATNAFASVRVQPIWTSDYYIVRIGI